MKAILLVVVLVWAQGSYAKDKDMHWICSSSDDPKGIYVKYEANSTPLIERGTESKYAFVSIDEDGDLRFNFNDLKETFIIALGSRDPKKLKKLGMRNLYNAGYYDFTESAERKSPVNYYCASLDSYRH